MGPNDLKKQTMEQLVDAGCVWNLTESPWRVDVDCGAVVIIKMVKVVYDERYEFVYVMWKSINIILVEMLW